MIRTVKEKMKNGFLDEDFRGKHKKQKSLDSNIKESIQKHIEQIKSIQFFLNQSSKFKHYLTRTTRSNFVTGRALCRLDKTAHGYSELNANAVLVDPRNRGLTAAASRRTAECAAVTRRTVNIVGWRNYGQRRY
eukprot:XP_016661325.1 PREDICTED: uncharacterized protein LOC107884196 [Acyrthosiphon pisum]